MTQVACPTLQTGSKDGIAILQNRLRVLGTTLVTDGYFGSITEAAVRAYQTAHGLVVDGIVGTQTWASLGITACSGGQACPTLQNGSIDAVRILQSLLFYMRYSVVIDGYFGVDTDANVRLYQGRNGLTVDGIVGPQTWRSLGFLYIVVEKCLSSWVCESPRTGFEVDGCGHIRQNLTDCAVCTIVVPDFEMT